MTTISKFVTALIVSFTLTSCHFDFDGNFGVRGNGNVESIDREISPNFDEIRVSRGLDVYLTQSDEVGINVEADENLHDIIVTEVEGNILKIYADENISFAKERTVHVNFTDVNRISASSGSDVWSTNTIRADDLELSTSSGADMELDIDVNVADCSSSSGSDLRVSGNANKVFADASSGSDIKAGSLKTNKAEARASSGADITVNTSDKLYTKATSGGDIKYYGNPDKVSKKDGVSGSVRRQ
jgi:hypothetical protein